jgi:signal transduction histidine kinase/ActR/RegA family two-component response regulator
VRGPNRPVILSAALFAVVLLTGSALVTLAARLEVAERRRAALDSANAAAWGIEQQLAGSLAAAHALAAVVRATGDASSFDQVAPDLYRLYGGMDSLQLAPDAVLRFIYPLPGNEAALGLDLGASPVHGQDVKKAKATRQLVLAGPFPLRQGGIGLAGRVAVFVRRGGEERFWGIATSLIRLPQLLEASRISRLTEAGYSYRLSRHLDDGREETFAAAGAALTEPVAVSVRVPNGNWLLRVAPETGWGNRWVLVAHSLALAVAFAFALLVHKVLRQPDELRRVVAERTAALEQAHRSQRAAEDALRQGQKLEAIGRLAGGIAHDFNNLLLVIGGHLDLLLRRANLQPAQRENVSQARAAVDRAAALTRQMLAFGRRQVLEPAALDLNLVISELMKMVSRVLGEHIELEVVAGPGLHLVWADRVQIEQVIVNLCVNARDAMPDGGRLRIETANVEPAAAASEPGFVRFTVTDSGAGIPSEIIEHVFEPFFTTKGPGSGTGLGLATVHGIVHQHHGWVEVKSAPGAGTVFDVYLPTAERSTSEVLPLAEGPIAGGSETILVAEDDTAVRDFAVQLLREAGYTTLSAADGNEALAVAAAHRDVIDLALLDVVMPRLGGRQTRDHLLASRPGLKVLFASGYSEDSVHADFVKEEGVNLLRKPYTRDQLLRAVRGVLDAAAPPR